jgi:hypothetical protein
VSGGRKDRGGGLLGRVKTVLGKQALCQLSYSRSGVARVYERRPGGVNDAYFVPYLRYTSTPSEARYSAGVR